MDELKPGLSVLIPAYHSARILPVLVERLEPVLRSLAPAFELIVVDDCSPDDTGQVIDDLAATHGWIRPVHMLTNYGQHNALLCAIRMATFDTIVTMDDDLQHPPDEIPRLLGPLSGRGVDVVYGTPEHEKHKLWRALASRMTKLLLQHAMGAETASRISAFRAFRTELREAFSTYHSSYVSIDALLTWGTRRFTALTVRHEPRHQGVSNYTFSRLLLHAVTMITAFSGIPLRFAIFMGLMTTLLGFGMLIYTVVTWLRLGSVVPGFAALSSMVSLFAGTQLLCLGIMGEYLARIHFRLMDRPPYAVRPSARRVRIP